MNTLLNRKIEYSAVIATYEPTDLLLKSLLSIIKQDVPPKEIIIIDDDSNQFPLDEIKELIPRQIDLIIESNDCNMGAGFSRNFGVSLANTDFVIFFDDDDVSLPARASIHINAFQNGAAVTYVSSRKKYSSGYMLELINPEITARVLNPILLARKLLFGSSLPLFAGAVPSATLAISKDAYLSAGGFDGSLRRLEDVDLALRLSLDGATFAWSSAVAVERNSTVRQDKGGLIETKHEEILLQKYGYLLGWWRREFTLALTFLRTIYFGGLQSHPKRSILKGFLNPFSALVLLTRFRRFFGRRKHDGLQGAK